MDFVPWKQKPGLGGAVAAEGGVPPFFSDILAARGYTTPEAVKLFLDAAPTLHDPLLMLDMDKAVERIHRAVGTGERILVYGDYDCDGVTSTVMLYDYLENAGADVLYYIPQREEEGYGLNPDAVERIRQADVQLVITVDNGVSSAAEIALAAGYGIDVVVTDHHRTPVTLPDCVAVVDPHREGCSYPFKELCGAGVVFKLLSALEKDNGELLMGLYGDLLAVATMADIVPLTGENRYFVRQGLLELADTQRVGLRALAAVAGIELEKMTSEQIAFGIAPRINVTGRIASVDLAVELLLSQDEDEARELAAQIDRLNGQRKEIEAQIVADIGQRLAEQPALMAARVLVVWGEGWHAGVIGITAARLVERYHKPCIILTRMQNGELRGSARSVEGFSIIEAIADCADHLIKYGGHPMAAGLSLQEEKLPDFLRALEEFSAQHYPVMPQYSLSVDCDIELSDITLQNIRLLETLQPCGCGNAQPVPVLRGVTIRAITPIGGGNHLRLTFSKGADKVEAVLFGTRADCFPMPVGTVVDCAVALSVNCWQGTERPSVRIVSIAPQGFPMQEKLLGQQLYDSFRRGEPIAEAYSEQCSFGRDELSAVFRLLRERSPYQCGCDWLLHTLGGQYGMFRLQVALEVLCELGLVSAKRDKNGLIFTLSPVQGKANLSDAPTYSKLSRMQLVTQR